MSELSTMTCPSWVALHGMFYSFLELDKAVVHVKFPLDWAWASPVSATLTYLLVMQLSSRLSALKHSIVMLTVLSDWAMIPSWLESCYFSKVILLCVGLKVTLKGRWF